MPLAGLEWRSLDETASVKVPGGVRWVDVAAGRRHRADDQR